MIDGVRRGVKHVTVRVDVVSVGDGDGFVGELYGDKKEFRIWGIDAPEIGQPFGLQSRNQLRAMIQGRRVFCRLRGMDRYGRYVAEVISPHWPDVSLAMVEEGWAWWYSRQAPEWRAGKEAQAAARTARRGLWQQEAPTPPWTWRGRRVKRGARNAHRKPH